MSMEFVKVSERTEYVSVDESLIGIYHLGGGNDVVLIDAGAKEEPELLEALIARGINVKALLCTHLHFDHISSAGIIWEHFKMPCYVHHLEKTDVFPTRYFPLTKLYDLEPLIIEGERFELIHTPGHTEGHLCFVTPDGVCCVGDTFMSEKPLRASKIPYFLDVDESIRSMEVMRGTDYPLYLLSHEAVIERDALPGLIDENIDKELVLYDMIKNYVTEPMDIEEMVTGFMKLCGIRNKFILDFDGYRGTVKSRCRALDYAGELIYDGKIVRPL